MGSASFQYDMRRLTEMLAFPKAWYRKSLAKRLFLGKEARSPDEDSLSRSHSGTETGKLDLFANYNKDQKYIKQDEKEWQMGLGGVQCESAKLQTESERTANKMRKQQSGPANHKQRSWKLQGRLNVLKTRSDTMTYMVKKMECTNNIRNLKARWEMLQ